MTKRTRRILFYITTLSFFVIAVAALFYSNGWRFDLETLTINRLGGIYFDKVPDGATLTVEKLDLQFNPSFLGSSILIANLFPKTYTAHIEKTGYQSWSKQIAVEPSLVTEVPPIIMLPTSTPAELPVASSVTDFWIKEQTIITRTLAETLQYQHGTIPGTTVSAWADDGSAVVTRNLHGYYYFLSLNAPSNALTLDSAFQAARIEAKIADRTPIASVAFEPDSATKLLLQTDGGLYLFDTSSLSITRIADTPVTSFSIGPKEVLYIADRTILSFPWNGNGPQLLPIAPVIPGPVRITMNGVGSYFALLNADGTLVLTNRQTLAARPVSTGVRTMLFSPSAMELAFTTTGQEFGIYTYGTHGQALGMPKTALVHVSGEDEQAIAWHKDSDYVFFEYPDALYLLEANDQPPINLQKIDSGVKKYAYDGATNTVFLLKDNGTLVSTTVQ
ncbi:hypothetical protein KGO95_02850 [Patescibacteria group bacterium]|nr:hypothetical protein [Patescibacteria group bacterium]